MDLGSGDARILVVDDDPVIRRLVTGTLEVRGAGPVRTVSTLMEAGIAIAEQPFQAAIVDLSLPDGNGMEFVHLVRRGPLSLNPEMMILVCSAYAHPRTTSLLTRLGANAVLPKPPDLPTLLKFVQTLDEAA